jgi:tetratricopeptide (TPR) repeat protein
MRKFVPIIIAIAGAIFADAAHGQAIVLKDGITKLGPDQFKVEGGKVMKIVKVGGNVATSELQLSSVLRLEWPEPEELTQGKALLASGKTSEALDLLKKGRDFFQPFKDVPGNHFVNLSFAYVEALGAAGKFEETVKAMPALRLLKLSEEQKTQLKILQLNVDRQTSSDYPNIIAQAQNILSETDDSAVGASLWMIQGDVAFKQKKWEQALFAYLRVPVFYGTQVQRVPEAELNSARTLAKMRRFEDAASYYKRIIDSYPGSTIAETAKTEEVSVHGLKNEDESPAKAGEKKDGEAKSDEAKPAEAKPAEAPAAEAAK